MKDKRTVYITESWVEETRDGKLYLIGDIDEPYETFTDDIGRLFASLQREYGSALKMYCERGDSYFQCGWIFRKKLAYEDSPREFYTAETWITLYELVDGKFAVRDITKRSSR